MKHNVELEFSREHLTNEKYALSTLHYKDHSSGYAFKVNFKSNCCIPLILQLNCSIHQYKWETC